MQTWTIELDVPVIEPEPPPPTRRAPHAELGFMSEMLTPETLGSAAFWFTEKFSETDEAPTRIDGKIRVFGEPIKLTKRGRMKDPTPKHPDGPGPSLESVLTKLVG